MLRVWLVQGSTRIELLADAPQIAQVDGGKPLQVWASGLAPEAPFTLELGEQERTWESDLKGEVRESWPDALRAVAGTVRVRAGDLSADVDVRPSKLALEAFQALVQALERLAPGLSGDLGGKAGLKGQAGSPEEATYNALIELEGPLQAALRVVARSPIERRRLQRRAVSAPLERNRASDMRWLAQNPHRALMAASRGRAVAVERSYARDLNTPENRSVLWTIELAQDLAKELETQLDREQHRIEKTRPQREAFRTADSNLWEAFDVPRLRGLKKRRLRMMSLRAKLGSLCQGLGFPPQVRPQPSRRTPAVESHPGYWGVYRIAGELKRLPGLRPSAAFPPLQNTDVLYELWATLAFVTSLSRVTGQDLRLELGVKRGWFTELPPGLLLRCKFGPHTLELHREPKLAYQSGSIRRLSQGGPLCPDLMLVVTENGAPVCVHIFDAKHSLPGRRERAPMLQMRGNFEKYGEEICDANGLPLVASCWILFPNTNPQPVLRSSNMLSRAWPRERLRGGAIPLHPNSQHAALDRVLSGIL